MLYLKQFVKFLVHGRIFSDKFSNDLPFRVNDDLCRISLHPVCGHYLFPVTVVEVSPRQSMLGDTVFPFLLGVIAVNPHKLVQEHIFTFERGQCHVFPVQIPELEIRCLYARFQAFPVLLALE